MGHITFSNYTATSVFFVITIHYVNIIFDSCCIHITIFVQLHGAAEFNGGPL